jgi:hypothetical protein
MVRLEKIRLTEKSWWASSSSPPLDLARDFDAFKTTKACCISCKAESKVIYNAGWACLNVVCPHYFDFGKPYDDATLDFVEAFLKERSFDNSFILGPLAPALITSTQIIDNGGSGFEKDCKAGIVCPRCQACVRRIQWDHWQCETEDCPFAYRVAQLPVSVSQAIGDTYRPITDFYDNSLGIVQNIRVLGHYDVVDYILPGAMTKDGMVGTPAGIITHFKANNIINSQEDGPNALFEQMQASTEFGLKRHPARQKGRK